MMPSRVGLARRASRRLFAVRGGRSRERCGCATGSNRRVDVALQTLPDESRLLSCRLNRRPFLPAKRVMQFEVNGRRIEAAVRPHDVLLDVLRDDLGMTG